MAIAKRALSGFSLMKSPPASYGISWDRSHIPMSANRKRMCGTEGFGIEVLFLIFNLKTESKGFLDAYAKPDQ